MREATPDEHAAIADLTALAYKEFEEHSEPTFWRSYEASTRETLLDPASGTRLVIDVDGEIAASVLYVPPRELFGTWNPHPEFRLLAVHPDRRNLRLGRLLIEGCEQRARSQGFAEITLHTTVLMQTAKAMYERRGYLPAPELDFEPVPGFTVWGYRKEI